MKKNLILMVLLVLGILAFSGIAYAISAYTSSVDGIDVYKINEATPGLKEVRLGDRLKGILQKEVGAITATGEVTLDAEDTLVTFVSGDEGNGTFDPSLVNGSPGQLMTFVLVTDGGGSVTVTPATKTGFTSFLLDDANDGITLRYINDTIGWTIAGNFAATIN